MAFLGDGTLLIVCGDGFDYREQALDLGSLLGKTLRIGADGSIPRDNPFVGLDGARPEIWSYGHRNEQGIVATPHGVYMHEHGPRGGDELNRIEPGRNYGWPAITYGMDYSGSYISPYTEHPGMEQPVVYWTPSIAPAGLAYYDGEAFPAWQGDLFVAALVEQSRASCRPRGRRTGRSGNTVHGTRRAPARRPRRPGRLSVPLDGQRSGQCIARKARFRIVAIRPDSWSRTARSLSTQETGAQPRCSRHLNGRRSGAARRT